MWNLEFMLGRTKNDVYLGDEVKIYFVNVNDNFACEFQENQFYIGIFLSTQKNLNFKDWI